MIVDGKSVKKIKYSGKTFLPVEDGMKFDINVYNDSNRKVTAVVSVDGLSVLDGKPADHEGKGYVIEPYSYVNIDGWRSGQNETNAFRVGGSGESYTEKMGHGKQNRGVIGVVVIPEKGITYILRAKSALPLQWLNCDAEEITAGGIDLPVQTKCCSRGPSGQSCRSANTPTQSVGTAFGETQHSPSVQVYFERDYNKKEVIVLYYDTIESLRQKGIPVDCHINPNPFPKQEEKCWCPRPSN
uniref:Uncharacterized protein n=1 Tax=viral metagenome TaxID=1070528 RepID=A0A6M3LCU8_9ZZZZ